jgi:uncharacterized caspase-like protein
MVLVLAAIALSDLDAAWADKRVALVIGNSNYVHSAQLRNPANDAGDIAAALRRLGFAVMVVRDADLGIMQEQLRRFSAELNNATVGLFYYAGHGLQVAGRNFLVPIDARFDSDAALDQRNLELDDVLRMMSRGGAETNIVILDACRDNPLANVATRGAATRSAVSRGLARVDTRGQMMIIYATEPGNVAQDGDGRNSPFTAALLNVIEQPDVSLSDMMIAVRKEVYIETKGKQEPWEQSSIRQQVYFSRLGPDRPLPRARDPEQTKIEMAYWDSIKGTRNRRNFEAYLKRYPDGIFTELAKITIEELAAKTPPPAPDNPEDKVVITDPAGLREIFDRLYELNFDAGANEGRLTEAAREAIREFEASIKITPSGEPTQGLLRRLREVGGLRPWGAIVYARNGTTWGRSWGQSTRKEAVASARSVCGNAAQCTLEVSFFGSDCGAFAHAAGAYALTTRNSIEEARKAALSDCRQRSCRIITSVCADGSGR